jgi:hypothetical protein
MRKELKALSCNCGCRLQSAIPPSFSELGNQSADPSRGAVQGRTASPADCPFANRATLSDRSHTTGKWLLIVSQQPLRSTATDSWGSSLR